jgi:hypothetical protein
MTSIPNPHPSLSPAKQRELELTRIRECCDLIFDGQKMLFCILVGDNPHDGCLLKYERFEQSGKTISPEYIEPAKQLFKLAATEFKREYSQLLCRTIEQYLSGVLTKEELREFKRRNRVKYPVRNFDSILDELADEGRNYEQL